MSTIRLADKIVAIRDSILRDIGTHDALMQKDCVMSSDFSYDTIPNSHNFVGRANGWQSMSDNYSRPTCKYGKKIVLTLIGMSSENKKNAHL